jgi:hypothetical protein
LARCAELEGATHDAVSDTFRQLHLCPASNQRCEANIAQAFSSLGAGSNGYVTDDTHRQLLALLVAELPNELAGELQHLFNSLTCLPPDFATFRATVKVCLLLQELQVRMRGHEGAASCTRSQSSLCRASPPDCAVEPCWSHGV